MAPDGRSDGRGRVLREQWCYDDKSTLIVHAMPSPPGTRPRPSRSSIRPPSICGTGLIASLARPGETLQDLRFSCRNQRETSRVPSEVVPGLSRGRFSGMQPIPPTRSPGRRRRARVVLGVTLQSTGCEAQEFEGAFATMAEQHPTCSSSCRRADPRAPKRDHRLRLAGALPSMFVGKEWVEEGV